MESVKLLPTLVKRAKDAAQSVKRSVGLALAYVKEKTLTQLLDLAHFEVYGYALEPDKEQEIMHLYCRLTVEAAVCPCCKSLSVDVIEEQARCVRDLDWSRKRTFLHFAIRRFDCPECGHRFTEELQAVAWRRHQTVRFEAAIYQRCLESSKSAVAKACHLSYSTVDAIFKRYAQRQARRSQLGAVRILGMDEIALKKRHRQYALVLSDLERRCVLAVLPSREQSELDRWFATLSSEQHAAIRVVSMDMWRPYRSFVERVLPHAHIVADRFHVMKQLNDQLSKARRQIQRTADDQTKEVLKGCRWLLVRNRPELSPEEQTKLQHLLDANAQLRTAYLFKEEFRLIFEKLHDREQARRFLNAWMLKVRYSRNKYLLDFVNTLTNWFEQILNYFDKRITNGFVEGMNRAIRFIISRAFGFRNFDNFRLHVLAQHGSPG
jgi:transposase